MWNLRYLCVVIRKEEHKYSTYSCVGGVIPQLDSGQMLFKALLLDEFASCKKLDDTGYGTGAGVMQ